jgi:hypothetical protein
MEKRVAQRGGAAKKESQNAKGKWQKAKLKRALK